MFSKTRFNHDTCRTTAVPAAVAILFVGAAISIATVTAYTDDTKDSWPALDDAQIRPGVRIYTEGGQCTSNFLFRDTLSGDLLLGLASHCVSQVGQPSEIHGIDGSVVAVATVAYNSYTYTEQHDFALIRLPDEARHLAHPAVLHFGGPTGMATSQEISGGDKFLFYGNSVLRQGVEVSNWHEGYSTTHSEHQSCGNAVTPGVPGDSGSGVLDGEGRALGVLITVGVITSPPPYFLGTNCFTNLDFAMAFAEREAGLTLELQTWDVLDPGVLPASIGTL